MKNLRWLLVPCFALLLVISSNKPALAIDSYTVYTVEDILTIAETYYDTFSGVVLANGRELSWYDDPSGASYTYFYLDGEYFAYLPWNDPEIAVLLAKALGLSLSSPGSVQSQNSASTLVSQQVFRELVVPSAKTRAERKAPARNLRTIGGSARYEKVEDNKDDGDLYGVNLGFAYDMDKWTVGVMLPYEHFDYDSHDGERIGGILFGQYRQDLTEALSATATANMNYFQTDLDFSAGNKDVRVKTKGAGLGLGLSYSQDSYEIGVGGSIQYNKDDIDWDDDEQYLAKVGVNAGYRILDSHVVNAFCAYTNDITDYKYDYGDDDLVDVGIEYRGDLTDSWGLNVGYKKTLDLDDYDNDTFYLGSIWKF